MLVRPLMAALAKFEASEPAMDLYFPTLVKSDRRACGSEAAASALLSPRYLKKTHRAAMGT